MRIKLKLKHVKTGELLRLLTAMYDQPATTATEPAIPRTPATEQEVFFDDTVSPGAPVPPAPLTPVPPVPPVPPAPLTPVPPVPPAPLTPVSLPQVSEVDSAGVPWDARIHAGTKTTYGLGGVGIKAEGRWKLKKGVDPNLVTELMPPVVVSDVPAPPAPPLTVPAPPVAGTIPTPMTFNQLIKKVTDALTSGQLEINFVANVLKNEVGVASIQDLATLPQLVPFANTRLFNNV